MSQQQTVAVIIPVFNEKNLIRDALNHFLSLGFDEMIVVDGRSTDGTFECVRKEFPLMKCFQTAYPDRAMQMNLGAFEARSDIFLFAHIDIRFPYGAVDLIRDKINAGYIAGGFRKKYFPTNLLLKAYLVFLNVFYLRLMRCLVGTNGIFVQRSVFEKISGFPETSFLEDVILAARLKKEGGIAVIASAVKASSRKYFKNGILRQILKNARIMIGYFVFHQNLSKLREIYQN